MRGPVGLGPAHPGAHLMASTSETHCFHDAAASCVPSSTRVSAFYIASLIWK